MKAEVCEVCGKPAEQKCSACKSVFYCSREHQKNHWKEHMKNCKAFKVRSLIREYFEFIDYNNHNYYFILFYCDQPTFKI